MTARILIVEDDHGIQTLLEAVLHHHGLECATTGDGDGALKHIAREQFGAILLDLLLPKINGFDVLRHLKNTNPRLLDRVIVVTAAAEATLRDSEDIRLARCVLRKPLDIDELMSEVSACLNRRRPPQVLPEKNEGQRIIRWRSR